MSGAIGTLIVHPEEKMAMLTSKITIPEILLPDNFLFILMYIIPPIIIKTIPIPVNASMELKSENTILIAPNTIKKIETRFFFIL
jgi:hypothetical protein